ncbi:MAG: AAA family ATPase, partial [Bifidobacterium castoris]|nr:AAA family ATPase [Bifidobacterium castoris]
SMRGALALTRCARVWAAADGRGYVIPDDVKALAVPVLAHRILLTSDAVFAANTPEDVLTRILGEIPAPQLDVR